MRVLVTGGTGFIGRHVVSQLAGQGHRLLVLTRRGLGRAAEPSAKVAFCRASLARLGAAKSAIRKFSPQACVHLAWQGIPDYSARVSRINLRQSINLIDFLMSETNCKKFIAAGSCFEYGKTSGACRETDAATPFSYIAWSKIALQHYLSLKCREHGGNYVWFRLFYVYGPGQRPDCLIPAIVRSIRGGKNPPVRHPHNANDFIFVEDIAQAVSLAVKKPVGSGVYNLGSGKATSVLEICKILERRLDCPGRFTDGWAKKTASIRDGHFWADLSKVRKSLGWRPRHDVEKGIQRTIESLTP
ncbi:MAG: NAD(P)-dependent oxidoreductase [Elusimicrobia bacterium]|nr:NAD(P)-dependent oxidoreductase [Elusimicrobiota bacterium]